MFDESWEEEIAMREEEIARREKKIERREKEVSDVELVEAVEEYEVSYWKCFLPVRLPRHDREQTVIFYFRVIGIGYLWSLEMLS